MHYLEYRNIYCVLKLCQGVLYKNKITAYNVISRDFIAGQRNMRFYMAHSYWLNFSSLHEFHSVNYFYPRNERWFPK